MNRFRSRGSPDGWVSLLLSFVCLVAVWSGCIVLLGAAFRLATFLFCIGYRC